MKITENKKIPKKVLAKAVEAEIRKRKDERDKEDYNTSSLFRSGAIDSRGRFM